MIFPLRRRKKISVCVAVGAAVAALRAYRSLHLQRKRAENMKENERETIEQIYLEKEIRLFVRLRKLYDILHPKNDFDEFDFVGFRSFSEKTITSEREKYLAMTSALLSAIFREGENGLSSSEQDRIRWKTYKNDFTESMLDPDSEIEADFRKTDAVFQTYMGVLSCSKSYFEFSIAKGEYLEAMQKGADVGLKTESLCHEISAAIRSLLNWHTCVINKTQPLSFAGANFSVDYITDQINTFLASNEDLIAPVIDEIRVGNDKFEGRLFYIFGSDLLTREDYKLSFIILSQIQDNDPTLSNFELFDVHNNLGLCYVQAGDYAEALEEYCAFLSEWERKTADRPSEQEIVGTRLKAIIHSNISYILKALSDEIHGGGAEKVNLKAALLEVALSEGRISLNWDKFGRNYGSLGRLYYDLASATENVTRKKEYLNESIAQYSEYRKCFGSPIGKSEVLSMKSEVAFALYRLDAYDYAFALPLPLVTKKKNAHKQSAGWQENLKKILEEISYAAKDDSAPIETWSIYNKYELAIKLNLSKNDDKEHWNIYYTVLAISALAEKLKNHLLHPMESIKSAETLEKSLSVINEYRELFGLKEKLKYPATKKSDSVVYYTSVQNATHLFETLFRADGIDPDIRYSLTLGELTEKNKALLSREKFTEKKIRDTVENGGKNCLTVMNADYMNDPTEGSALLSYLLETAPDSSGIDEAKRKAAISVLYGGTPEQVRDKLLSGRFAFLKSFNQLSDHLIMWSMYGSDRKNMGDSNGVCIRLNPETFAFWNTDSANFHAENSKRPIIRSENPDDFRLYRVLYLGGTQAASDDEAKTNDLLKRLNILSASLGEQMRLFNETTDEGREMAEAVRNAYRNELAKIAYLFKDASYRQEKELRLLLFRNFDANSLKTICRIPSTPEKLCLKPYFQVYVDEVILGPKLEDADNWIPYFQFEVSKIRHIAKKKGITVSPTVSKSSIPYR